MQISIDFHSTRQSGEHKYGSHIQASSFIPIKHWLLYPYRLPAEKHPHSLPCVCAYRSARAEADRPDPAETESHCSDHLHTGGGQTKCRQVNDKVGDRQRVSCNSPPHVLKNRLISCQHIYGNCDRKYVARNHSLQVSNHITCKDTIQDCRKKRELFSINQEETIIHQTIVHLLQI